MMDCRIEYNVREAMDWLEEVAQYRTTDDFKITYEFNDTRFYPSTGISLDSFKLHVLYYIYGKEGYGAYEAKSDATGSMNAVRSVGDRTIRVIFENHGLEPGYLMSRITISLPDDDFSDGWRDVSFTRFTGIKIVEDECSRIN